MLDFADCDGYYRVRFHPGPINDRDWYNVGMLSKYINEWRFHPSGQFGMTSDELIIVTNKLVELNRA